METVELGGVRLHVLVATPGAPGEADRVFRELGRLSPAVVLVDLDTDAALRARAALSKKDGVFEPSFVDALFAAEVKRRFAPESKDGEHPVVAAARFARDKRAELLPILPLGPKPGFFARRRATKALASLDADAPDKLGAQAPDALAAAKAWDARAEADGAHKRILKALQDGRAPIVLVVQAHRATLVYERLMQTRKVAV